MKTELIIGCVIGVWLGMAMGYMATRMYYEEQIVEHGYGSFKMDKSGNEYFEWNTK